MPAARFSVFPPAKAVPDTVREYAPQSDCRGPARHFSGNPDRSESVRRKPLRLTIRRSRARCFLPPRQTNGTGFLYRNFPMSCVSTETLTRSDRRRRRFGRGVPDRLDEPLFLIILVPEWPAGRTVRTGASGLRPRRGSFLRTSGRAGTNGRGRSPRPDNINDRTYGKRQGRTKMEGAPKRVPVPTPVADGATRADRPAGGGEIPEYYVLEYPDWVNTIARTCTGEFVFVRQYRRGLDRTCFELCAGVRDPQDATPDRRRPAGNCWRRQDSGGGQWSELMVVSANPSTPDEPDALFRSDGRSSGFRNSTSNRRRT